MTDSKPLDVQWLADSMLLAIIKKYLKKAHKHGYSAGWDAAIDKYRRGYPDGMQPGDLNKTTE